MNISIKRRLILFALGLSAFSVYASGCPVKIPNIQVCRDKGRLGAICAHWINPEASKEMVSFPAWNDKRFGMMCMSEASFANIKAAIEKLCQTHQCVEQADKLMRALK